MRYISDLNISFSLLVDGVLEVRRLDHLAEYLLSLLGANHEKEDVS